MVTDNKYRWDFIGLSTDDKPTPATSDRVVDGSTFYCSDTSKLYVFCKDTWYEKEATGGGTTYTAGDNITIADGVISATDTTYNNFTGTDGTDAGAAGLVPAPAATDADKFLKSDGTWATAGGGSGPTVVQTTGTSTTDVMSQNAASSMVFADPGVDTIVKIGAGINTGLGTNNIMIGQNVHTTGGTARSNAIVIGGSPTYNEAAYIGADKSIAVGYTAYGGGNSSISIGTSSSSSSNGSIAIGQSSVSNNSHTIAIGSSEFSNEYTRATQQNAIAIGINARATQKFSVALGSYSEVTRQGEVNIGDTTGHGYNSTNYRVLGGVHDGQSLHDAATVAQGNTLATAAPTTSTAGVLGQLYTDTTNMHTYQCTAIDTTDPDNPAYTWTQRW